MGTKVHPAPARPPLAGIAVACLGSPGVVDLGSALAGPTVVLNVGIVVRTLLGGDVGATPAAPGAVPVLGVDVKDRAAGALDLLIAVDVHYPQCRRH